MRLARRLLTAVLLSCAGAALAQGGTLPETLQARLQRGVEDGVWPLVVAGYVDGTTEVIALPGNSDTSADASTRFALSDAGAVYNGLLLAQLASSGRLRMDDPISNYLPAGFDCADARVCAITLQQLASGDSGLPPLPANLFPRHPGQVWRDYRETDLLEFLANYQLPQASVARESALGQVLLGWILGRADGGGYAAALARHVSGPLGLGATSGSVDGLVAGNYDGRQSQPPPATDLVLPLHLNSSATDQLQLLRAMLRPGDSPLRAALLLSRQPRSQRGNSGLGWRINLVRDGEQEWPLVWQQGNRGGYSVFLGFRTDQQKALVLLGNSDASVVPQGLALLSGKPLPALPPKPVAQPQDTAEYAGLYEFAPGEQLLVRAASAGLTVQSSGRLSARLRPLGPDLFDLPGEPIQLAFQRDALGRIEALRWSENGVIVPVRRLSARAPQLPRSSVVIAPEQLAAICGDYRVDNNVLARFHCGERPALQFSGGLWRELTAFASDRFGSVDGDFELVAQRDGEGKVSALLLVVLGNETTLPRVSWQALAPEVARSLQQEQILRAAAIAAERVDTAEPATTESAAQAPALRDEPGPWRPAWLAAPELAPRPPVTSVLGPFSGTRENPPVKTAAPHAGTNATTSVAKPAQPAAAPSDAPPAVRSSRVSEPVKVQPAPASSPAVIEALPEHEPRHRFVPPRKEDEKHDAA